MTYHKYFDLFYIVFGLLSNIIRLHRLSKYTAPLSDSLTVRVSNEIKDSSKFYSVTIALINRYFLKTLK